MCVAHKVFCLTKLKFILSFRWTEREGSTINGKHPVKPSYCVYHKMGNTSLDIFGLNLVDP